MPELVSGANCKSVFLSLTVFFVVFWKHWQDLPVGLHNGQTTAQFKKLVTKIFHIPVALAEVS